MHWERCKSHCNGGVKVALGRDFDRKGKKLRFQLIGKYSKSRDFSRKVIRK